MTDREEMLSELIYSLRRWTDAELFRLRDAINEEIARHYMGDGLEAKAEAAERMYDD